MKTAEEYLPAESDLAFEGGIMPPDGRPGWYVLCQPQN